MINPEPPAADVSPAMASPPPTQPGAATTSTVLLEVRGLHVRFGNLHAVNDVSFSLQAGTLLGLIGPNGAGKTTLLRALAALQPIAAGCASVLGNEVERTNIDTLRHIGFAADNPPAYDGMTVRDFLRFIGRGYDLSPIDLEERIEFWLEKVWLRDKANHKIKHLSRGMKQRIGIARTLLANPALILLDEPAAGLDPAGRVQFRQLLTNLREQGKSLIVSSHILADMEDYCTHVAIMSKGRMVQFGTVHAVSMGLSDGRRRYAIELTDPVADIAERLGAFADLQLVSVERTKITIEYWAERHRAAALLKELLAADLPVASFAPDAQGLEEAYMRSGVAQVD